MPFFGLAERSGKSGNAGLPIAKIFENQKNKMTSGMLQTHLPHLRMERWSPIRSTWLGRKACPKIMKEHE